MRWLFAVLTCCALACGSSGHDHPINDTCPVQPGKPVDSAYEVVYEGRTIRFCCESCVDEFKEDPKKYLANIDVDKPPETVQPETSTLDTLLALRDKLTPALLVTVGLMLVGLVAARLRQRFVAHPAVSTAGRRVERVAHAVSPSAIAAGIALTLIVGFGAIAWRGTSEVRVAPPSTTLDRLLMLDVVERGEPFAGKVVVYRGNDERSPQLFNGGKYRTTTFTLSLRTAGSNVDLQVGDPVDLKRVMLRLEIERAPNTAAQFYRADAMQRVTLVGAASGTTLPSSAQMTVLVPDWKWEALLKIDDASNANIATLCTEPPRNGLCGAHYGIYYAIRHKDGKLLATTKLHMGATYVPADVPREEWLSYRPIETIPDGKNVTDPKLLGLPGSGSSTPPAPQQPIGH